MPSEGFFGFTLLRKRMGLADRITTGLPPMISDGRIGGMKGLAIQDNHVMRPRMAMASRLISKISEN
jgi:hypothetical protein